MKFTFKRKYTASFFFFLILAAIAVAFYVIGPQYIKREQSFFDQVLMVSLVDSFLLTIFFLGLYRINYYVYHNRLEIHRSLRRTIILDYSNITDFIEYPNDKIFFIFGNRPSFKIRYKVRNKIKNYRIRIASHDLFKLIVENEKKIHITTNK